MDKPIINIVTKSPGRKEVFERLGIKVNFSSVEIAESKFKDPVETVLINSILKCKEASKKLDGVVVTFDTVVYIDGIIMGKPKSREEAIEMLKRLSGRQHCVYTGIAIYIDDEIETDYGETKVWFKELSMDEIEWHVDNEEYWRYAGGYRIQGLASVFVEKVEGDFYTVIGVPLNKMYMILRRHGINLLEYIQPNHVENISENLDDKIH